MGLRVGQIQASGARTRQAKASVSTGATGSSGVLDTRPRGSLNVDTALIGLRRRLRDVALVVLVLSLAIEGVLIFRLWAQLTTRVFTDGIPGFAYDLSEKLVAPFRSFEPEAPVRSTGILDMSTVVAIEVYLVAAIGALALLLFTNLFLRIVIAVRNHMRRQPVPLIHLEESVSRLPEQAR